MGNLAITYQHIADILSFATSKSKLEASLNNPSFDWDTIVVEGSKHLVLPAIYCRLEAKQLLHVLPKELENYLEEISNINRNRNKAILKQVHSISQLLNEYKIDHVFLKGSALLALGCYKDNAERMVGDIDILISEDQLKMAFDLIKVNGYDKTFGYAYETKNFRHLDRLISDHQLAAIELHSQLLNKKYNALIDVNSVLKSKIIINTVTVPSIYFMSKHQILGWQINDNGHYYNSISLKSFYDSIILKTHKEELLINNLIQLRFGQSYLELAKSYFEEFSKIPSNRYMKYRKNSNNLVVNYKFIRIIIKSIKMSMLFITKRLRLIFSNRNYRKHVLKMIFLTKK